MAFPIFMQTFTATCIQVSVILKGVYGYAVIYGRAFHLDRAYRVAGVVYAL